LLRPGSEALYSFCFSQYQFTKKERKIMADQEQVQAQDANEVPVEEQKQEAVTGIAEPDPAAVQEVEAAIAAANGDDGDDDGEEATAV
jgi:hypothetical protein